MTIGTSITDFIEIEQQKTVVYQILCDIYSTFKITDPDQIKEYTDIILNNLEGLIDFKTYLILEKESMINNIAGSFKWDHEHVISLYLICVLLYKNLLLQREIEVLNKNK